MGKKQEDDAINQDVSSNEEVEDIFEDDANNEETKKSPRQLAMEEIIRNRHAEFKKDTGLDVETASLSDEDVEEEEEEKVEEEDKKAEDEVIKAKIDGVEETLTKDELEKKLREYQKHKAADKRLEEAASKLKEVDELITKLNTQVSTMNQGKQTEDEGDSIQGDEELEFDVAEFARKVKDGDEDDVAAATKELLKTLTKKTSLPKAAIETYVKKELETHLNAQQKERERLEEEELAASVAKAEAKFFDKFKEDIEKYPKFKDFAAVEDRYLLTDEEWKSKSLEERFIEAGRRAKAYFEPAKQETKQDKKDTGMSAPRGHTTRNFTKKDDEQKPKTHSQIIAEIARARGQAL